MLDDRSMVRSDRIESKGVREVYVRRFCGYDTCKLYVLYCTVAVAVVVTVAVQEGTNEWNRHKVPGQTVSSRRRQRGGAELSRRAGAAGSGRVC